MNETLTKMLHTAVKGKAPVVALPCEGKAPLCINRKRLATWLKGVTVTSVEVVTYEAGHRLLKITGRAGNVRTSCSMIPIQRNAAIVELSKWAEKERAKMMKVIAQGATGTAAIKVAMKAERIKAKAAKLAEIETGGSPELVAAKAEVINILNQARKHGAGTVRNLHDWEAKDKAEKMPEIVARHVAHHNISRKTCKRVAVIQWRMKALRSKWYDLTKFNTGRRKTTANKFFKASKALEIIQVVNDYLALKTQVASITPAFIPNPRWPGEEYSYFSINPLDRPRAERNPYAHYWQDSYSREGLAIQLRAALRTIAALTPPPDEIHLVSPLEVMELAKVA